MLNYFCLFGVFSCDWLFFHPSSSSSSSYHNSCCHSHICNLNQHLNSDGHVALLTSQKRHEKQKRLLHSEVKCDICRGQKLCMQSCMLQHLVPLEFEGAVVEGEFSLKNSKAKSATKSNSLMWKMSKNSSHIHPPCCC